MHAPGSALDSAQRERGGSLRRTTRFSAPNGTPAARAAAAIGDQEDMIRAIHLNGLRPVIDRSFGLDEITTAFEYYQTESHFGKIGLEI